MKLYLAKIVEDRSPTAVAQALERCLKQEAWEIQRRDTHVVALGIGTSRNSVNLADNATFKFDASDGATTVEVNAEFQEVWFLSEEAQNDKVHERFESIFSNMRAALNLAPESTGLAIEAHPLPASVSVLIPPSRPPNAANDSTAHSCLDRYPPPTTPQTSGHVVVEEDELEANLTASPTSTEPPNHPLPSSAPLNGPLRFPYRTVSLIASAIVAAVLVASRLSHTTIPPLSSPNPKSVPSAQHATLNPSAKPHAVPAPPTVTPLKRIVPSQADGRKIPSSPATRNDLRFWLEQWAAAERTKDAKAQASFYADEVRPYLSVDEASRDTVYHNKQNDLLNRKGLWTFKIEDVSIRKEGPDAASVLLKKHFMTQSGSVQISERRISSFLTLNRTRGGWHITGERDLH